MWARQTTTSEGCSDEYRVAPGDPCVPVGDLDCDELAADGISDVEVVGDDLFDLDRDGDGVGCEGGASLRTVTPAGDAAADVAPFLAPVALVVVIVGTIWIARRAHAVHTEAESEEERRTNRFAVLLAAAVIVPSTVLGALVLALLGLE